MFPSINAVHVQAGLSVAMLIAFLVATTLLQQRTTKQVTVVLNGMAVDVKATELHASAVRYFKRRQIPNLFTSGTHALPIWFLIFIVSCCSLATYFGAEFFLNAGPKVPSYVLGGAYAVTGGTELGRYQSGTVFIGSMAFLGAYLWTMSQLVNRINNDDMNPSTYYFLSIRILSACLVAGVARHIIEAMPIGDFMNKGPDNVPVGLAVLGFLIGWNPTLWINEMLVKIGDLIKMGIPSQRWPQKPNVPLNLTLLMVQGLTPDTSDRLNELNIDNCQRLASENAVILWVRTSYTLELIVDWIAQAQLCVRFEDSALQTLRVLGIRDIFSFRIAIDDAAALNDLATAIAVKGSVLSSHLKSIDACPAFARLAQLRTALMP